MRRTLAITIAGRPALPHRLRQRPTRRHPPPSPTSTPATTASTTTTPPDRRRPPVMPALARQKTPAGAKAFVRYYVEVLNHSYAALRHRCA